MKEIDKKFVKHFNGLKTDVEKWEFLVENKYRDFHLVLDNDATFGCFKEDHDREFVMDFNYWIGSSIGTFDLLEAIGIEAEGA